MHKLVNWIKEDWIFAVLAVTMFVVAIGAVLPLIIMICYQTWSVLLTTL